MKKIPIFLASDNNYAPFIATTIASICSNTNCFCEIFVLDSGINQENKLKIKNLKKIFSNFNLEFININPQEEFKEINYKNCEHISLSTFNRFLIPKIKPNLTKVLYLDSDIIVLDDIYKLYKIDLENYIIGASWNKNRILYNTDTKDLMNLSDNYKYFNAGVLLINPQKWIENNITSKLFSVAEHYGEHVLHADETLLNKVFDNNYKILDIKFNYTDYDVVNSADSQIIIRHFATALKPWIANFSIVNKKIIPLKNFDDFWHYAQMTEFYEEINKRYQTSQNTNILVKRMNLVSQK